MYYSLLKKCTNFHLYIIAFDEDCYTILKKMNLTSVTIIKLDEFETDELLKVKKERSKGEYCWTCTPYSILFCLEKYGLESCTYLDADLFFYSDPKILIDEMGNHDVLITEHRYTKEYDQSATSGKYCVQFVTIKNTLNGILVLKWWHNKCIEWCFAYYDDGRFGDQMYLDNWTKQFNGVHVLRNLGGGVAPWNAQQYKFKINKGILRGVELNTKKEFDLVFYHFHAVYHYKKGFLREFFFEGYKLSSNTLKVIYSNYTCELIDISRKIQTLNSGIDGLGSKEILMSWYKYLKVLYRRIINNDKNYKYWIKYGRITLS